MEDVFKLIGRITVENAEANQKIDDTTKKAENAATRISQGFEKTGTFLSNVGSKISSAGKVVTATLSTGIAGLVAQGINYNSQMENYQMNLTTLLGSADKAKALLSDLKEMAATTPFETTDLIGATETMIGFGIAADDSQKYLGYIGNIAMGNSEKLKGLSLAFAQVQSTGKLTGQDLLQMINQGFNPLLYISKMTGKSMATLKEEMSDGAISAQMVADAFAYATQEGQPFYNAMENGATTISGRISTLKDNFNMLVGSLTESLLPTFERVVDKAIEIVDKFNNLDQSQKDQILKWGGIAAAIGPALIVFGKVVSGVGAISTAFGKLTKIDSVKNALTGFIKACGGTTGALGAVAGIVALVASVFVFLKRNWDKVVEVFQNFINNTGLAEKFEEIKSKIEPLVEKFKGLGDLFEVVGGFIVAILQPAISILAGLFDGVVSAISPLLDAIGGVLDVLGGLGTLIKSVFTGDMESAKQALLKIKDGIVDIFKGLWNAVKGALQGFLQGFLGWWKGLFDAIGVTDLFNKILEAISNWWSGVVTWAEGVWNAICTFFAQIPGWIDSNVIQPVVEFFTNLWTKIQEIWDTICNVIQVAFMFIGEIISAAWQIITLPFMFLWENCKEYVFAAWEWIKEKVSAGIDAIRNVITTVSDAISLAVETAWNWIKEKIITPITDAYNKVKEVVTSIKNAISEKFNEVKTNVLEIWNNIKSTISNKINEAKTAVSNKVDEIRTSVTETFNQIKSKASEIWNNIKSAISNKINEAKTAVSNKVNEIKSSVSSVFDSVKSKVTTVWNGIKTAIQTPIEKARDIVKNAIEAIKNAFNFEFKWPKLKMPHFKISGSFSLDPPSVPHFGVEWYKKAMNNPMILSEPTAFSMSPNGNVRVAGEAGDEVVGGAETLMNMIANAVGNKNAPLIDRLQAIIEILIEYLPVLANLKIILDTGVLVGETAPAMDEELGIIKNKKERGR